MNIIIEQTKEFSKRVKFDSNSGLFYETEDESLLYIRKFPFPYGWIKESGTPPDKHLDAILITEKSFKIGEEIEVNPIGVFVRNDLDHKIICVEKSSDILELEELSDNQLKHLYSLYPKLYANEGWFGSAHALKIADEFY